MSGADSLWLLVLPEGEIKALRAIRTALRWFNPEASLEDADVVVDTFNRDGFAWLGDAIGRRKELQALQEELADEDCVTALNINPEKHAMRLRSQKLTAEGATPEEVFAQEAPGEPAEPQQPQQGEDPTRESVDTALALVSAAEGNPLRAAITAANLARTTGQVDVYYGTLATLIRAFPWLRKAMNDKGSRYESL